MILDVHMSPWQYRDGYAERIDELLAAGRFVGCRGRWRVRRKLASLDVMRERKVTVEVYRVRFDIVPLDAAARAEAAEAR